MKPVSVQFTHIFQMFIPNLVQVFGSQYTRVNKNFIRVNKSQSYHYEMTITKTGLKALNQPKERCDSNTRHPNTSKCIAGYIERQIGCSLNIHGGGSADMLPCTSGSETGRFKNITTPLQYSNANKIYELTGCLASCERNEYSINDADFHSFARFNHLHELHLRFKITKGSYKEEEQYIIYDFNSFIADVGGLLGLLLGSSALSLYDEIESLFRTLRLKSLVK